MSQPPQLRGHTASNTAAISKSAKDTQPAKNFVWRAGYTVGNCIQLIALGLALEFILFYGTDLIPLVKLCAIALLLFAIARGKAWIFLLAIIATLFLREDRTAFLGFEPLGFFYCMAAGIILLYTLRANRVRHRISSWAAELTQVIVGGDPSTPAKTDAESKAFEQLLLALGHMALLTSAFVVCMIGLEVLPTTFDKRSKIFRWLINSDVTPWVFVLIGIAVYLIVRELSWKQLGREQAGVYLRTGYLYEYQREFGSFLRRRYKLEKKAAKRRKR